MRWEQKNPPSIGSLRTIRRFIWWRTALLGEGRWGEWAYIRQTLVRERWWSLRCNWESISWADGPEEMIGPEATHVPELETYPSIAEATRRLKRIARLSRAKRRPKPAQPLSDEEAAELSPEIVKTVTLLRQWGYETTDSGDGSQYARDKGWTIIWPMVAIELGPMSFDLQSEADRLRDRLTEVGVQMGSCQDELLGRRVQASYSTNDGKRLLILFGVTDKDLP